MTSGIIKSWDDVLSRSGTSIKGSDFVSADNVYSKADVDALVQYLLLVLTNGTRPYTDSLSMSDNDLEDVGNISLDSISSDSDTSILVNLGGDAGDDFIVGNNALVVEGDNDRIGMGTATPISTLTLYRSGVGNDISLKLQTDLTGQLEAEGFNMSLIRSSSDVYFTQREPADLIFYTNNAHAMSIKNGGKVGIGTTAPASTLDVNGSKGQKVKTITTTTYTAADESTIVCDDDTASGTITISLPAVGTCTNRIYRFIKIGSTGDMVLDGDGSETINGSTTKTYASQWDTVTIQSNGTAWFIIG